MKGRRDLHGGYISTRIDEQIIYKREQLYYMSILIYKQPKAIDLAGNHLFFQVKGTDFVVAEGEKAKVTLSGSAAAADGDSFEITCMGNTHKIVFTDLYLAGLDGADVVLYSGQLPGEIASSLQSYPPIGDFYNIEGDGGTKLYLTAKNNGPDYDVSGTIGVGAWQFINETAGKLEEYRPNYAIKALLSVEDLSSARTYKTLPEFALGLNNEQLAEFEIGEIIRRRYRNYFQVPDFNSTAIKAAKLMTMQYRLELREVSGSDELDKMTIGPLKVLNGKVNKATHPDFDLRNWLSANKRFLTNMPERIYTYPGAKHYLYFMSVASGTTSGLRVRVMQFHTGASAPQVSYADVANQLQDGVVIIPVTDLMAADEVNGRLYESRVAVVDADDKVIAGEQVYQLVPKRLYAKALIFQNRFGAFDTVTVQEQSNTVKVTKDENRRVLNAGYSRYAGDLSSDEADLEDIFTAETGPIPMGMAQHYKELVSSNAVFLQTDDRFVRVWIEKGSFKISDEGKDLQEVKFKYKAAFAGDIINSELKLPEQGHKDYSGDYLEADYQ